MSVGYVYGSRHLFAPRRLTLKDQSKQNPGSVSGPTSSGSFALSLIRRSPQRAIHGTVRLARRPASHPPDQCQSSAVTYVALCVVSANAVKKRFFNYRATLCVACRSGRSASDLECAAQMCALCVTQRFCDVSRICLRLKVPFRPSAPYFEGPK
ncbi:Pyrroline-5-carboxylate reductase [Pseudomonas syringae pv. actinidiae]|nr:Pyrroline-5-carboxylate reductase [Pseudomonas syringae pv. actinidiae]